MKLYSDTVKEIPVKRRISVGDFQISAEERAVFGTVHNCQASCQPDQSPPEQPSRAGERIHTGRQFHPDGEEYYN